MKAALLTSEKVLADVAGGNLLESVFLEKVLIVQLLIRARLLRLRLRLELLLLHLKRVLFVLFARIGAHKSENGRVSEKAFECKQDEWARIKLSS